MGIAAIAENIHVGRVNESEGPHLFAKEASVRLSPLPDQR
jgi:hypothetical protein